MNIPLKHDNAPTKPGIYLARTETYERFPEVVEIVEHEGRLYANGATWDDPLSKIGAATCWSDALTFEPEENSELSTPQAVDE